ncbi:MAG: matrixin family metalloprotease [Rubrivivax sp.]|nr:matrixin family metalloprotease [Rubrivivax sp.]
MKLSPRLLVAAVLAAPTLASAFVLGGTTPGKWGSPVMGTGATVTWSLMASGISCASPTESPGCTTTALASFMPTGYLTEIQAAFSAWSAVANITFTQVVDSGRAFDHPLATSGNIRLGGHVFDGAGGVLAHGYYPPLNGTTAAGDIHFDVGDTWKVGVAGPGFSIFQVMAHEIGHAIGLDHTLVPNSLMNTTYTLAFLGPQADDIAGAQHIYGMPIAIPEPTSALLMALGLAGLVLRRRAQAG